MAPPTAAISRTRVTTDTEARTIAICSALVTKFQQVVLMVGVVALDDLVPRLLLDLAGAGVVPLALPHPAGNLARVLDGGLHGGVGVHVRPQPELDRGLFHDARAGGLEAEERPVIADGNVVRHIPALGAAFGHLGEGERRGQRRDKQGGQPVEPVSSARMVSIGMMGVFDAFAGVAQSSWRASYNERSCRPRGCRDLDRPIAWAVVGERVTVTAVKRTFQIGTPAMSQHHS